jgi:DNA-binding NarL/FixJ family response regulator
VMAQLARGRSNKEIAAALGITERTARTHVSNILLKLGLRSRTEAALLAARETPETGATRGATPS